MVPAPHSGGPPFRGSGLGLTLADLRDGGPESGRIARSNCSRIEVGSAVVTTALPPVCGASPHLRTVDIWRCICIAGRCRRHDWLTRRAGSWLSSRRCCATAYRPTCRRRPASRRPWLLHRRQSWPVASDARGLTLCASVRRSPFRRQRAKHFTSRRTFVVLCRLLPIFAV